MKSIADRVMENTAIKSIILSMKVKWLEEPTEMFNKNPNRNTENVVRIALSRSSEP